MFTPHKRRPAPELLHVGAAEHDVNMGPGLIEEDVDVVDEHNSQTRLSSSTSLRTQGRATTPVRRRQSTPEPLPSPSAPADPGASSHASRRCASMSQMECCRLRNSQSTTMRCGWLCSTRFGSEEHTRRTVRLLTAMDTFSKRSSMRIHSPLRQGEEWRLFCLLLSR